jgi:hypothetical protein
MAAARRARWIIAGVTIAVVALAAARLATGARAGVPLGALVAQVGLVASALVVGGAVWLLLAESRRAALLAGGIAVAAWGLGLAAPLARVAFPPPTLFAARMGGAQRDVTTPPAPQRGRYVVTVARPRAAGGELTEGGEYILHVGIGTVTQQLSGVLRQESDTIDLRLEQGQRVHLFFERAHGLLDVKVAPPPLPRGLVRWAALCAALLGLLADVVGLRGRPRLRGLLAGTLAATAVLVALLDPRAHLEARAAWGLGGLAAAGGVAGVVLGALAGWVAGRGRRVAGR